MKIARSSCLKYSDSEIDQTQRRPVSAPSEVTPIVSCVEIEGGCRGSGRGIGKVMFHGNVQWGPSFSWKGRVCSDDGDSKHG